MDLRRKGRSLFAFYMFGFFVGNIYVNLFAEEYITSIGIFADQFLKHYISTDVNEDKYMVYLLGVRLIPMLVLFGLGFTRIRKMAVIIILAWTGFMNGIIVAAAIIKMGLSGTLFYIVAMFPHMPFYFLAYTILFWNMMQSYKMKWNYFQIIVSVVSICIGIITECYVNPVLMKMFLKTV